jgi:hypothetical protein
VTRKPPGLTSGAGVEGRTEPRSSSWTQRRMARPWFRRRRVGLGWRPVAWQGWLVTLVAAGLVIGVVALLHGSSARVPIAILVLALYAVVALLTGGAQAEPAASDTASDETAGGHAARVPAVATRRDRPAPSGPPALVVEHLTKRFGERLAVDDVSFTVAAGEVFGFLGPNGAARRRRFARSARSSPPRRDRQSSPVSRSSPPTAWRSASGSRSCPRAPGCTCA